MWDAIEDLRQVHENTPQQCSHHASFFAIPQLISQEHVECYIHRLYAEIIGDILSLNTDTSLFFNIISYTLEKM